MAFDLLFFLRRIGVRLLLVLFQLLLVDLRLLFLVALLLLLQVILLCLVLPLLLQGNQRFDHLQRGLDTLRQFMEIGRIVFLAVQNDAVFLRLIGRIVGLLIHRCLLLLHLRLLLLLLRLLLLLLWLRLLLQLVFQLLLLRLRRLLNVVLGLLFRRHFQRCLLRCLRDVFPIALKPIQLLLCGLQLILQLLQLLLQLRGLLFRFPLLFQPLYRVLVHGLVFRFRATVYLQHFLTALNSSVDPIGNKLRADPIKISTAHSHQQTANRVRSIAGKPCFLLLAQHQLILFHRCLLEVSGSAELTHIELSRGSQLLNLFHGPMGVAIKGILFTRKNIFHGIVVIFLRHGKPLPKIRISF